MRQHIEHILAAAGAVAVALFISYFNTGTHVTPTAPKPAIQTGLTPVEEATTTTPIIAPNLIFSTTSFDNLFTAPAKPAIVLPVPKHAPKTPVTTPTTASTPPSVPVTPKPIPSSPALTPTPTPVATPKPAVDTSELTTLSRSIVNILCTTNDGSVHALLSGSGVVIDSRGIILTVAHVGQAALLQEFLGSTKESCVARTGSPARNAYHVRPIYVSSHWIHAHATNLISSERTESGEDDIALLAITSSANGSALPVSYPAVPFSDVSAKTGDTVWIGSYGSQYLTNSQILSSLTPTLVTSTILGRYKFADTSTADVLNIQGSKASQEGSSGGAIVDASGGLIGLIVTNANTGSYTTRELHAITTGHVVRSFSDDMGKQFDAYINGNSIAGLVSSYAPTASSLGAFLAGSVGLAP